ncbi:MAG: hypothetical protein KKA19_06335 [Candidatus Margulisbacteria bacterium]|nr:hypothetical protein [Candidatus Margulisiibacteriota bacterium]
MTNLREINFRLEELVDISEEAAGENPEFLEELLGNLGHVRIQVIVALLEHKGITENLRRAVKFFGEHSEGNIADYYQVSIEAWEEIQGAVQAGLVKGSGDGPYSLSEKGEELYKLVKRIAE